MSESLRESLEAASNSLESAPASEAPAAETTSATPAPEPVETSATPAPEARTDGRDERGRFAAKATAGDGPGQAAPPKVSPTTEGAASSTQPPAPAEATKTEAPKPGEPDTTHAPSSWKIGARQQWAQVPADIRREIHRRELETQQRVSRADPALRFQDDVQKALAPIAATLQARGTTPQRLIASYAQFDQALTSRDPATQAHAIKQVMQAYGIPVEALADALDGKSQPQQRQPTYEEMREQLRQEMRAEWQQQQRHAEYQSHTSKVQEFASKADPILFNDDVRHDMAALIEAAAGRGIELSLEEAFNRAVLANPEARAIVQQREEAKRAATQQEATKRAQAAASSVKGRPASPVGGSTTGNSLRADLEAAAALVSGRT